MALETSEKSKLLEVALEGRSVVTSATPQSPSVVGSATKTTADNGSFGKGSACTECKGCTFRVRIAVFIGVLLIQLPLLVYYLSTSQLQLSGFADTYNTMVLQRFLSKDTYQRTENFTLRSFAQGENLTTVYSVTPKPLAGSVKTEAASAGMTTVNVTVPKQLSNKQETVNVPLTNAAGASEVAATNQTDSQPTTTTTTTTTLRVTTTVRESTTMPATTQRVTEAKVEADGAVLPECPPEPPNLQGRLKITFDEPPKSFASTGVDNPLVQKGGHAKPPYCIARHKVAIIIPFRDRDEHLQYFVEYMHPILQRQQLDYQIFIINQNGHGKFNRAKLMNIGFVESQKIYPFNCFSFHDVDLILEDDRSLYWCSDRPRHMSAGVDKFNYVLPYGSIFGGVTLLSKEQMDDINGFSNVFWGWGGEDDDVYNRLAIKGHKIIRYPMNIARYRMISHKREKGNEANPKRFELIRKTKQTFQTDGLNTLDYKIVSIEFQPMYTNITVDVKGPA